MNKQETIALLEQFNLKPTRSLGQNFLIDNRVIAQAVAAAAPDKETCVIEIGPGLGGLTVELAKLAGVVKAVEIDRHILPALRQVVLPYHNVDIIHADAMQIDFTSLVDDWSGPVCVTANLPYYITSPIVEKLLSEIKQLSSMTLMVQKEAAARLAAKPGSKLYGPAAVLTALLGPVKKISHVPAASFYPRPHVDSTLIYIGSKQEKAKTTEERPRSSMSTNMDTRLSTSAATSSDKLSFSNATKSLDISEAKRPVLNSASNHDVNPAKQSGLSHASNHDVNPAKHPVLSPDFLMFMNNCFARRRKTLVNSLRDAGWPEENIAQLIKQLQQLDLSEKVRPETISPEQYAALFARYNKS